MKNIFKIPAWAIVIGAVLIFSSTVNAAGKAAEKPSAEKQVPYAADFTLKDLKGNSVTLSSFKGKKALLVFSATWCPYCVAEIPDLNAFYDKHQDKDVKLINVDIQESIAKVTAFAEKHKIKYTVVLDADGKVAGKYEVYGIPTIILIDEDGIIKYRGSRPKAGFEELLK